MLPNRCTVFAARSALFSTVWTVASLASAMTAEASMYTVAGFTFDPANAPATATGPFVGTNGATWPTPVFTDGTDHLASFGRLLAPGDTGSLVRRGTLGDNDTRHTVELTFASGFGLSNLTGDDIVVYEQGDANQPEAYAIAVRVAGALAFTDFRYEIYDAQQGLQLATGFDLSDFGLAADVIIDAIQIMNLQNNVAGNIVDYTLGGVSGFVVTAGATAPTGGYATVIGTGPSKDGTIPLGEYDPDISYVGGLHNLVSLSSASPVPEPTSLALVLLGGIPAFLARRRIKSQQ